MHLKSRTIHKEADFFDIMGTSCTDKCLPAFFLWKNSTYKNVYRPQKVGSVEQFCHHQWWQLCNSAKGAQTQNTKGKGQAIPVQA